MARKNDNSGCGCLIIVLGLVLFYSSPGFAILLAVGGAVIYLLFRLMAGEKVRTVTHSETFLGNRKKKIMHHNTGKVVEQVTSPTWTGGTKKVTRVVNRGQPGGRSSSSTYPRGARPQACNKCGDTVTGIEGRYVCACGHRWGRR